MLIVLLFAVGGASAQTDCTDVTRICSDLAAPPSAVEAELLARTAASVLNVNTMTVAVVDRAGRALAVFQQLQADPSDVDLAVGLARTTAFFSHDQAPLSSRTVRFLSGVHFPPGVRGTANAPLYGIEATNHGCDLNVQFNLARCIPRPRSVVRLGNCDAFDVSGCGPGIVTGKFDHPYLPTEEEFEDEPPGHNPFLVKVDAGGVPLYRGGALAPLGIGMVGGIGVAGIESGAAEYAAFTAARENGFFVDFRADKGQVVFIDGIRLPFIEPREWPRDRSRGSGEGRFVLTPRDGACAADRYLVGPRDGTTLGRSEVDRIVRQSVAIANQTRAAIRLPLGSPARMVIAVSDIDGTILGLYRMRDATVFSIDVAVAKSRNVIWFSGEGAIDLPGIDSGSAVNNRTISFGAQPLFPPGIDRTHGEGGPWFDLFKRTAVSPCSQGSQTPNRNQNGIVFFPGSTPLYRDGVLVGGLGISGDGVEQDDYVSFHGATGFLPDEAIWSDRLFVRKVRLPFFKFPRQPEGVTREELKIGPEEID